MHLMIPIPDRQVRYRFSYPLIAERVETACKRCEKTKQKDVIDMADIPFDQWFDCAKKS